MTIPLFDIVLIVVVGVAFFWAFRFVILYGRRHHAPIALLVVAGLTATCGLASALLGAAHLAAILGRASQGEGFLGASTFTYDFTFHSLILVGFVVAIPGFFCLSEARGLTRHEASAWKNAFLWSLWLLAVNALLWRAFAPLLAALALVNLVGLVAARKRFRPAA